MWLESNDVCEIILPHFWYLSNFTCILGSIRLSLANNIDAIHWKRTNIRRVLHQSSSISALPEHPFWDVSVAQLVALMSGVVLGGVAEVVGSNLARGKIFTASIDIYICEIHQICSWHFITSFDSDIYIHSGDMVQTGWHYENWKSKIHFLM